MRKKLIITLIIIMILIQTVVPIKVKAFNEKRELFSIPAQINHYQTETQPVEENEMTGLDLVAGILIEPTVEFFTFVLDSIMSVFSGVMKQEEIQFVMVDQEEKESLPELGNVGATFTIEDMEPYKSATGKLTQLDYPRFTYSPEEIFAGNIDLLDINFIEESNSDDNWLKIRSVVAEWYKILRMVAIVGLLSVLIYVGIKIILSSNTKDKAKYKEMITNWFMAVVLAFSMHYIMAFILAIMEEILGLFSGLTGVVEVVGGEGINFTTNLIGLARFQMQQQHFSAKIGHLVIYTALVVFTFKFTFVYLKRVLRMAFLTVISPIVAITYPIDKMDGEAKGFKMWLREYIFNALLQPMHYMLYYILVTSSLALAANNPIYGIAALMFISQAEKLLKKIFGFDKAKAGTVGGIAGAFTTSVVTTSIIKHIKDPLHPLSPGKGKIKGTKSGENKIEGMPNYIDEDNVDFLDDTTDEEVLLGTRLRERGTQNQNNNQDNYDTVKEEHSQDQSIISDAEKFFSKLRQGIPMIINEYGDISFDGENYSIEDILQMLSNYKINGGTPSNIPDALKDLDEEDLRNLLRTMVMANESVFIDNNIQLQYIDGDLRSSNELLEEIMRLNEEEASLPLQQGDSRESKVLLKKLKRRMAENDYIERNGGVVALKQQEDIRKNELRNTNQSETISNERIESSRLADRQNTQQRNNNEQEAKTEQAQIQGQGSQMHEQRKIQPQKISQVQPAIQMSQDEKQPQQLPQDEKQAQKNKHTEEWNKFKQKSVVKGISNVGKTIIKPTWDTEKSLGYNGKRLVGNIVKGVAGATVGVAAATVQAGISITDGKYKPMEGVATVGAGMVGVSKIAQTSENLKEKYGKDKQSLEKYSQQWFNRDDIINSYNREYPGEGKEMRRRAVNNYVSRGVTEFKEQKQAMKYANMLKNERGLNEDEADKIAVATLQYKQSLARNNNYTVLFDASKRKKYIDARVEAYSGASSKDSIRRLHDDLIENVREFDRINR